MSESRREIMGCQALWAVDVNFLVLSIFFFFSVMNSKHLWFAKIMFSKTGKVTQCKKNISIHWLCSLMSFGKGKIEISSQFALIF